MHYRIETYFSLTLLSVFWQRLSPLLLALQGLKSLFQNYLGVRSLTMCQYLSDTNYGQQLIAKLMMVLFRILLAAVMCMEKGKVLW